MYCQDGEDRGKRSVTKAWRCRLPRVTNNVSGCCTVSDGLFIFHIHTSCLGPGVGEPDLAATIYMSICADRCVLGGVVDALYIMPAEYYSNLRPSFASDSYSALDLTRRNLDVLY